MDHLLLCPHRRRLNAAPTEVSVARALPAVDVEGLSGHEAGRFEIEDGAWFDRTELRVHGLASRLSGGSDGSVEPQVGDVAGGLFFFGALDARVGVREGGG